MKHFNDYHALARQILQLVGGPSNVISVNHCQTRLRFVLRNEALADTAALQQLDGVLTVVRRGGQYMVVVGSQVPQVYAALMESGLSAALPGQVSPGKAFLSTITGVFGPILGVMSATGILKGVLLLLASLGLMDTSGGAWRVLYGLADSLFYFLPVLLGYTAALHFDLDPFVGLLLGLTLCYPDLTQLEDGIQFLGMPIQLPSSGSYTTSVLPVLFFCLWLVVFYKENAANPILWSYGMEILAIAMCLLAVFRLSAYLFYRAKPRRAIFACMLALITSLATLTDSVSLGARAVLGGWGIGTAVMCWIIINNFVPPAPEEDTY